MTRKSENRPMQENIYEVIIIGGGPAGLTAGLYASRAGLSSFLIEKGIFGGQITYAEHVENFPGFPQGISGLELGEKMQEQATRHGLKTLSAEVTGLEIQETLKTVKTTDGNFTGKAVILAGGAVRRKLGATGEGRLTGRGISYCAVCDGAFFQDQAVAVIGGGDTAITEALHLTKFASKITIIHRRDQLRATQILKEKAQSEPKIDFLWDTTVSAIEGSDTVQQIKLLNIKTGESSTLQVGGVFISVGTNPDTDYVKGILPLDESGYIITNEKMETSIPGVLAAGDIRHNSARQAITAAGDGATAAIYAQKYLTEGVL
ncbi:MAG: thioredoxin-disulfide reductase [Dehalococcoidales bacterium]|nr:thioredoxin-disulfide reductase [Dehalococcoidales bacterium]